MSEDREFAQDIGKLLGATEALTTAVAGVRHEMKETDSHVGNNGRRIASLRMQVTNVTTQIAELRRTVSQGNGQPSLTALVTELNIKVASLQGWVEDVDNKVSRQEEAKTLSRGQIIAAGITLVGTLVAAIAALIVAMFGGRG